MSFTVFVQVTQSCHTLFSLKLPRVRILLPAGMVLHLSEPQSPGWKAPMLTPPSQGCWGRQRLQRRLTKVGAAWRFGFPLFYWSGGVGQQLAHTALAEGPGLVPSTHATMSEASFTVVCVCVHGCPCPYVWKTRGQDDPLSFPSVSLWQGLLLSLEQGL